LLSRQEPPRGLFAAALAEGFAGAADKARDNRLDPTELSQYVQGRMAEQTRALAAAQQPQLFLPDDTPPRLSDEAKQAIVRMLFHFNEPRIDSLAVRLEAEQADRLARGQPEPMLTCGLLLLKAGERDRALEVLQQVRQAHAENL